MARNGKVYLSAPPGDDAALASLLMALKRKRADAWRGPAATDALTDEAQRQLGDRDALVRILNTRSVSAPAMRLELAAFLRMRSADAQEGEPTRRIIINLITDAAYTEQPEDAAADITISTVNRPTAAWLPMIYKEIGQMQARAQISGGWFKAIAAIILVFLLVTFFVMFWYAASHHLIDI